MLFSRYQVDDFANLRVYKDDPDEETWELVAQTQEELQALIEQLQVCWDTSSFLMYFKKRSLEGNLHEQHSTFTSQMIA